MIKINNFLRYLSLIFRRKINSAFVGDCAKVLVQMDDPQLLVLQRRNGRSFEVVAVFGRPDGRQEVVPQSQPKSNLSFQNSNVTKLGIGRRKQRLPITLLAASFKQIRSQGEV